MDSPYAAPTLSAGYFSQQFSNYSIARNAG
jgi:hypothetical protein